MNFEKEQRRKLERGGLRMKETFVEIVEPLKVPILDNIAKKLDMAFDKKLYQLLYNGVSLNAKSDLNVRQEVQSLALRKKAGF